MSGQLTKYIFPLIDSPCATNLLRTLVILPIIIEYYGMRFSFESIICLNGDLPSAEFFHQHRSRIIAADGAAWKLYDRGIEPDVVVGDMDSFSERRRTSEFAATEFVWIPDQDSNDFEKILVYTHQKQLTSLLVCGIHGGEFEHTLNNWSVLTRYAWTHAIAVYDAGRLAVPVLDQFELTTTKGELISIIPQPLARLSTRGLQWELSDEELELGVREGARNRASGTHLNIRVHTGAALVFFDADKS